MLTKLVITLLCVSINGICWDISQTDENYQKKELPTVFQIGSYEREYEELLNSYVYSLLDVCNNDMLVAHRKLMSMFSFMQSHAATMGYDANGIKLWINIFWYPDGKIKHLAFHLKPHSRNVPIVELTAFLESFVKTYQFPQTADEPFFQETKVSFPLISNRITER